MQHTGKRLSRHIIILLYSPCQSHCLQCTLIVLSQNWIEAGVTHFSLCTQQGQDTSKTQKCKCPIEENSKSDGAKSDYFLAQWWGKNEGKKLWSISSYLWLNLCFQIWAGVRLISGMAVTEYKMQLKDTGFSYAVPDTFTWGLIQTPSSKTFIWSRTHGSHSHCFIPLLCVLNRSLVLSSVGSPIPLLTLSHGALLLVGLIPSVASSTGAAYYSSVVFLSLLRPSLRAQTMFLHVPDV